MFSLMRGLSKGYRKKVRGERLKFNLKAWWAWLLLKGSWENTNPAPSSSSSNSSSIGWLWYVDSSSSSNSSKSID